MTPSPRFAGCKQFGRDCDRVRGNCLQGNIRSGFRVVALTAGVESRLGRDGLGRVSHVDPENLTSRRSANTHRSAPSDIGGDIWLASCSCSRASLSLARRPLPVLAAVPSESREGEPLALTPAQSCANWSWTPLLRLIPSATTPRRSTTSSPSLPADLSPAPY